MKQCQNCYRVYKFCIEKYSAVFRRYQTSYFSVTIYAQYSWLELTFFFLDLPSFSCALCLMKAAKTGKWMLLILSMRRIWWMMLGGCFNWRRLLEIPVIPSANLEQVCQNFSYPSIEVLFNIHSIIVCIELWKIDWNNYLFSLSIHVYYGALSHFPHHRPNRARQKHRKQDDPRLAVQW